MVKSNAKLVAHYTTLTGFVGHLKSTEQYNAVEGYHYWDVPNEHGQGSETTASGTCTNGARLIAKKFGGKVMGYTTYKNPSAVVGRLCGGHDFAVVGDFLVDFWAWHVSEDIKTPVFYFPDDDDLIEHLYGNWECWTTVANYGITQPASTANA